MIYDRIEDIRSPVFAMLGVCSAMSTSKCARTSERMTKYVFSDKVSGTGCTSIQYAVMPSE